MLRKAVYIFAIYFLSSSSVLISKESDFITYDWLTDCAKNTSYTDHIPHFRRLFNTIKVRGFLECGCGYSSKYFMDHCDRVISIEFMNPGSGDVWFKTCKDLFKDCSNWFPLAYNSNHRDVSFNKACAYANSQQKDYSLIDSSYRVSLDRFFKRQIHLAHQAGEDIDVAFVDPGVYIRGDMVKILLECKIPIVVAHDTACDPGSEATVGHYSWFVVKTPDDYEKIFINFGQGTTFWINKNLPEVIESFKEYQKMVSRGASSYKRLTELADQR